MGYGSGRDRNWKKAAKAPTGDEGESVEVAGVVSFVAYSNERWMAGKLTTAAGEVGFAGNCAANVGEEVRLRGEWKRSEKHGMQVAVREMVLDLPVDQEAIAAFLARSEEFAGIGKARARAIAEAAGDDFEAALQDPEGLAARAGVPTAVVTALAERWAEARDYNVTATNLARYGVTPARARKLIEAFGSTIVATVESNPYWLIGRASGVGFRTVDKIALAAGVPKNSPGRVSSALQYVLKQSESKGHTWFERTDLYGVTKTLLCLDRFEDEKLVDVALDEAINAGHVISIHLGGVRSAIFRARTYEQDVRSFCVARDNGAQRDLNPDWASEAFALSIQPSLYPEQAHACAVAWASRFSVITGGAGVGKTYVVQAIYEGARQNGLSVALCATTGKAAKRLTEAVGANATTIHRLLGCIVGAGTEEDEDGSGNDAVRFEFTHDENNPVDFDLIVIDEVSMMPADWASDLFRAIDFARTQVVLVGDHNQLPPVGAGALLRDLFKHRPCPVVELNKIVRQAGPLKVAVNTILEGRVHTDIRDRGPSGKLAGPWVLRTNCKDATSVEAEVERLFHELGTMHMEDRFADGGSRPIDPVRDVLYLSPQKKKTAGVVPLNALIQRLACERDGRPVPERVNVKQHYGTGVGDRVMWTKNDYTLDIMNGTLGEVIEVLKKGDEYEVPVPVGSDLPSYVFKLEKREDGSFESVLTVPVKWQHDPVTGRKIPISWTFHAKGRAYVVAWQEPSGTLVKPIPSEKFVKMDLAYAMTVHKSQGSEAPVVVCVCTALHDFNLSRNLLYTGVSRARKACYIVGDMQSARKAARKVEDLRRRTVFSVAFGTWTDLVGQTAPALKLEDDGWSDES